VPLVKALTLLALASVGLVVATPSRAQDWETPSVPAKGFVVEDLEGRTLRSEELEGRIVVIDFWATWCSPCIRELPELVEYHRKLEGRDDVVLLSFDVADERADLEAFVAERQIPFRVFPADDLIGPYELVAFPTKLVIDMRQGHPGIVRFRKEGYTPAASIEARVEELLAAGP